MLENFEQLGAVGNFALMIEIENTLSEITKQIDLDEVNEKVEVPSSLKGKDRDGYIAWQYIKEKSDPQTLIAIDNTGSVFRCNARSDIKKLVGRQDKLGDGVYKPYSYHWYLISTEKLESFKPEAAEHIIDQSLAVEIWKHRIKLDLLSEFDSERVDTLVKQLPAVFAVQMIGTYHKIKSNNQLIKVLFENDYTDEFILNCMSEHYFYKTCKKKLGQYEEFVKLTNKITTDCGITIYMSACDQYFAWSVFDNFDKKIPHKFKPNSVKPLKLKNENNGPLKRLFIHKLEEYCSNKFSGDAEVRRAVFFARFYLRLFKGSEKELSIVKWAQNIIDNGEGYSNKKKLNNALKKLYKVSEDAFIDLVRDLAGDKSPQDSYVNIKSELVTIILKADIVKEHCLNVTVKRQFKQHEKAVLTYDSLVHQVQWKKDFFKFLRSSYSGLSGQEGTKENFEALLDKGAVEGVDLDELRRLKFEAAKYGYGDFYEDYIWLYCVNQLAGLDEDGRIEYLQWKDSAMTQIIKGVGNKAELVGQLVQHARNNKFVLQTLIDESTLDQLQEYKSHGANDNNAGLRLDDQQLDRNQGVYL